MNEERSLRIGHRYGMPKKLVRMTFARRGPRIDSRMSDGPSRAGVSAWTLGWGRVLGRLLAWTGPLQVWPVGLPSGSATRAAILRVPRVQPALITSGKVALKVPWLRAPVRLLPLGVYLPGLVMRLPPPWPGPWRSFPSTICPRGWVC